MKLNTKKLGGIFVVVLMLAGMIGGFLAFGDDEDETPPLPDNAIQVDDFLFYETEDGFFGAYLQFPETGNVVTITFRLDPREASSIPVSGQPYEKIMNANAQRIYVSYNPNQENISHVEVARAQVARMIPLTRGITPIAAFTEDYDPINPDIPLRNCDDATIDIPVIVFEIAEQTQVYEENNCIHVQGKDSYDLMLAADRLGMWLVGIKL